MERTMLAVLAASLAGAALADVNVGVTLSVTGPAAPLGIPERNTIDLLPRSVAGEKVNYIVLDDASDSAAAIRNARRLIAENQVDALIGSTTTANSLAMVDEAAAGETPMISLAASAHLLEPMDDRRKWVFKTPQDDTQMVTAIVQHMTDSDVHSVAYIGFADAYGEGWWNEFSRIAEARRLRLVGNERYGRADRSVAGQIGRILDAHPDAILIGGAGTPAALPLRTLRERGYTGRIYQTHGVAGSDFLRACGGDCEGNLLPAGPVLVAAQLPGDSPVRQSSLAYVTRYEAVHGRGSATAFGAHAWDAGLLLQAAIPRALGRARPGTREFRAALRDALENLRDLPGAHGIFNLSPRDHQGLDQRARVMVTIEKGTWKLVR